MSSQRIPAVYMRGGTSKGVFFLASDLPSDRQMRERTLLRLMGSPDPYRQQIDGMGGATSSTSKVVIVSKSQRPHCDLDYLFGAVAIDSPTIDWSGNCGNLTAAVAPFAIGARLLEVPADGIATVRIWQCNIGKKILAHVPMRDGEALESGDFKLDGVAFPGAQIRLEFLDPGGTDEAGATFPTGRRIDPLDVPGLGTLEVTLINAGNPMVCLEAAALGLRGTELPQDVNGRKDLLELAEAVRSRGAVAMGLAATPGEATATRPHTPKVAVIAKPAGYAASDGTWVDPRSIDLLARVFSMGRLHHAMTGTGAVALAAAAAVPGTIVHRICPLPHRGSVRLGHPSGTLGIGVEANSRNGQWIIEKVLVSRSARRLMEGWARVPQE